MDKKMFKIGFVVGVLLIIGIAVFGFYQMKSVQDGSILPEIELAKLELKNSNGEKVNLKSGKPVVVNFWATWCVPCVQEFPEFELLNTKYRNEVDIVMASDEEMLKIDKFKTKKKYNLKILRSEKPFEKYNLSLRPATYFYNSNGELVHKIAGGITKKQLEAEITKLLNK